MMWQSPVWTRHFTLKVLSECFGCVEDHGEESARLTLQLSHAVPDAIGIGNLEENHFGVVGCGG